MPKMPDRESCSCDYRAGLPTHVSVSVSASVCVACCMLCMCVCPTEIKLKPLQVAISDAARKCLKLAEQLCVCVWHATTISCNYN